ncbi:MAG: Lrp/AsnC family transcriptional regulator, partial [Candidatus Helarchaeota archaeon]|nr:Lrp/AsnC family transcriptional regulator [Candidatus Helarchaeota archaeon]
MVKLDQIDRRLLNILQNSFPLVEKPFEYIGKILNISEDDVIEMIRLLKNEKGIIRQISPVFDTKRLGYKSSLIAFKVPEEDIDRIAEIINKHPGVSHNYKRNCEYNLWFTITVPPESDLERNYKKLIELSNISEFLFLPAIKLYKLRVKFDFEDIDFSNYKEDSPNFNKYNEEKIQDEELSEIDIDCIRTLQNDLPLVPQPFKIMAENIDISHSELLSITKRFIKTGKIRRLAAVINHRNAGFLLNVMVVWNVSEWKIDEYGAILSRFKQVSHCYRRPIYPNWQYPLYSMIHARNREQCENIISD